MSKKSDAYEQFVPAVVQELAGPDRAVYHQKAYANRRTGTKIIIDVSFTTSVIGAEVVVVVECKRHKNKVRIQDVRELRTIMSDIAAHKGIIITTKGFQKGAIEDAKANGVALAILTDKRQKRELVFVVNAGKTARKFVGFWQGNLRASLEGFDQGYRFEGVETFFSLLMKDENDAAYREKLRELGFLPQ